MGSLESRRQNQHARAADGRGRSEAVGAAIAAFPIKGDVNLYIKVRVTFNRVGHSVRRGMNPALRPFGPVEV